MKYDKIIYGCRPFLCATFTTKDRSFSWHLSVSVWYKYSTKIFAFSEFKLCYKRTLRFHIQLWQKLLYILRKTDPFIGFFMYWFLFWIDIIVSRHIQYITEDTWSVRYNVVVGRQLKYSYSCKFLFYNVKYRRFLLQYGSASIHLVMISAFFMSP